MTATASLLLVGISCLLLRNHHYGEAFSLLPQPPGYTPQQILDLAQKRYPSADNNNNNNNRTKFPMKNKVAVITGAAGGIGAHLSTVVHRLGGTVVALDCNQTGLDLLCESLLTMAKEGRNDYDNNKHNKNALARDRIVPILTHHQDLASVSASADLIRSKFDAVDLLINNAGMTYRPDAPPGRSVHGHDLAFTVNFLSAFLLTEKLLPIMTTADSGRIVQLTSTYHWKVDGSELLPQPDGTGPIAYQGKRDRQSLKHVERSYGNTKLAQIWHARTLRGCTTVCACPTWVGTGIGGEESRAFLERLAFPVEGAGITSAINAMFRTEEELTHALNDGTCLVANSRILEWIPEWIITSKVVAGLGWRDAIVDLCGLILLLGQRFTHEPFILQKGSPESYNDKDGMDNLYQWSRKEVEPWL